MPKSPPPVVVMSDDESQVVRALIQGVRSSPPSRRAWTDLRIIKWVSEHLLDDLSDLRVADVPNGDALALLLWAKKNENAFRHRYDMTQRQLRKRPRRDKPWRGGVRRGKMDLAALQTSLPNAGQETLDRLIADRGPRNGEPVVAP